MRADRRKPTHRIVLHLLLLLSLVNLTTGCFATQPIEGTPEPESEVQVVLTEEAALRVSRQARRPVEGVAGRVIQAGPDSLVLAVRWREIAGGSSGRPGPDVVRLAMSEIESIQRPEFSFRQTLVMVVVGAVVVAALVGGVLQAGTGNNGDGPTDNPPPDQN